MSIEMDEEIKRWTARRKSALVLEIIQGKPTVSDSSRQFDLSPSEEVPAHFLSPWAVRLVIQENFWGDFIRLAGPTAMRHNC